MTEWGIDTLFNPGKRHMDEEKRRLQSTREEIGDSSGGRRIDLESGTVTISRGPKNAPADSEDAADAAESAEDETAEDESAEAVDAAESAEAVDAAESAEDESAAAEADRSASRE
ncbi:MAG TPA: DUF6191 domain-containing protein [Jatrophihabitans sp.]|jgi:hypothetical protein|uniref:DUF6191 domain-containing protein n=1 Tax=Jatrophihabitans sp. TaxID=1932789 RepID=UPI002F23E4F1